MTSEDTDRDEKALALREDGQTFAGIARALDLSGTVEANAAFNRALRRKTATEQDGLRQREMARLDALGQRVRDREDLSEEEMARRMRGLDRLRKALLST
jgi:hypothetical protein